MEFVVAGHSHIFAMGAPQSYQGAIALLPAEAAGRHGFFLMEEWKGDRADGYWQALNVCCAGRDVVLVYNGNQIYGDFLIEDRAPFDVVDDDRPFDLAEPGRLYVPHQLMRQFLHPSVRQIGTIVENAIKAGAGRVLVTGSPAPVADYPLALQSVKESEFWIGLIASRGLNIDDISFIPPRVMRTIWGILQELMREVTEAAGGEFVPVPAETLSPDGFRLPDFRSSIEDFTHGNDAHGRLVLEHALGLR